MTRTKGPLRIGFSGTGYAYPDPYKIDNGDSVPVIAETRCRVCFTKREDVFFKSKNHEPGGYAWSSKGSDVTPEYVVVKYGDDCPKSVENTYSIKVGSGRRQKSKRKSERTSSKTSKGRARSSPRRKARKRTGRKSSSRRR